MKNEQRRTKNKLTTIWWLNTIIFIGLSFVMVYLVGINGKSESKEDFMWERFAIILTVAIIPLALKLFHTRHKRIKDEELPIFLKQLEKLFNFRLAALDIVILINFTGFYFISALNFIYLATITIFAFLMCYPTEAMIDPIEEEIITNDKNNEI